MSEKQTQKKAMIKDALDHLPVFDLEPFYDLAFLRGRDNPVCLPSKGYELAEICCSKDVVHASNWNGTRGSCSPAPFLAYVLGLAKERYGEGLDLIFQLFRPSDSPDLFESERVIYRMNSEQITKYNRLERVQV